MNSDVHLDFPLDPRLKNIDTEIAEIVAAQFQRNIDLVGIHLRDARNLWYGVNELRDSRVLSKAALLLAAAALESNLVYLAGVALRIAEERTGILKPPQVRVLKGVEEKVDENGKVIETSARQSLGRRLQIVPSLLGRFVGRKYNLKTRSAAFKKLLRTIARRDAIVHPRWDRYVDEIGSWEAAEAIDAVELYLNSVSSALHPYLFGYFSVLYTIPGSDHHEVAVGHRTLGKRGPNRRISTMASVGLPEVFSREWTDSSMMIQLALAHGCEGDSQGSMLTRAALVLVYSMLDAQLAAVAQWKMFENPELFTEAEILCLNEYALGVGHDGEVWVDDDHQSFKKRIKAVPAILFRRLDGKDEGIDLSKQWGLDLIQGQTLRNLVMHSAFGEPLVRITKEELVRSARAVFDYFEYLAAKSHIFEYMNIFLRNKPNL